MAGLVFAERGIIGPGVGRMEHVKVRACADTQYSTLPDIDRKLLNASPLVLAPCRAARCSVASSSLLAFKQTVIVLN